MGKLASISSKPMLREYAQGAAQGNTMPLADFIAPTVNVATSVGQFKVYTEKHRFRIPDTRRALGGRATELGFDAEDKTYNCQPHALDFPVDNLEELESEALESVFQEGADSIAEVAGLAHEKRVIDAARTAAGAGTTLSVGSSDDVIDQLDGDVLEVMKAAKYGSLMGVGIAMGATFWRTVKNHASVKNRFVAGAGKKFANPNFEEFGTLLLGNAEVRATFVVFDDAPEGKDEDIKFLLDSSALIFARHPSPTRRDPSFMKTFRLRNRWMVPGSYVRDDGRAEVAKFDWSADVQVTNTAAIKRRNIA